MMRRLLAKQKRGNGLWRSGGEERRYEEKKLYLQDVPPYRWSATNSDDGGGTLLSMSSRSVSL
jgi:hypothetical protein